jgi:hypothetical protein
MTRFTLIALTGPAGAGKDSVADYLVQHAGFTKLAFAGPLRAEITEAFDLFDRQDILNDRATKEQPHDALALRNCQKFGFIGAIATATHACVDSAWLDAPRSPRQILQWWGTEYRRRQNDHYWIMRMAARVGHHRGDGRERLVVTDCRFANELKWVHDTGGRLWRVDRPGLALVEGTHASAQGLPPKPRAHAAATTPGSTRCAPACCGTGGRSTAASPRQLHVEIVQ